MIKFLKVRQLGKPHLLREKVQVTTSDYIRAGFYSQPLYSLSFQLILFKQYILSFLLNKSLGTNYKSTVKLSSVTFKAQFRTQKQDKGKNLNSNTCDTARDVI